MSDDKAQGTGKGDEPETVRIPKTPVGPRRIPARGEDPNVARRPSVTQAKPQRIGPTAAKKPSRRVSGRWIAAFAGAVLLIVAVGVAGFVYLTQGRGESAETQIRDTLMSFTQALSSGDLATLRADSCGDLANYYRDIPDAEFADVHSSAVDQGNIPVVDGVDAVQINGDTAIAQVIAYTAANPAERSPRTFDLRLEGEEWKVC